jgi:hypothetical protein
MLLEEMEVHQMALVVEQVHLIQEMVGLELALE